MVTIVINIILVIALSVFLLYFTKKVRAILTKEGDDKINTLRAEWSDTLSKNTQLILTQLNENIKAIHSVNATMGERLDNAAKVVGEVKQSLGALDGRTKQIYEVGKDIAGLQEILRAPKMRGGLGEMFLGNLLEQIMPRREFYELQYSFKSGERVDAIIRIGNKFVCVDSKFPLESFNRCIQAQSEEEKRKAKKEFIRAVKDHIDSIAKKYILPDEGSYDFALMYIPAENVYYETITKDSESSEDRSISTYAMAKRVIPVSPNSLYAYLQVIILGIKGLKIEEKAQDIIKTIATLKVTLGKFIEDFEVVGTHIDNIKSSYERAEKSLGKFETKLSVVDSLDEKKKIEGKG